MSSLVRWESITSIHHTVRFAHGEFYSKHEWHHFIHSKHTLYTYIYTYIPNSLISHHTTTPPHKSTPQSPPPKAKKKKKRMDVRNQPAVSERQGISKLHYQEKEAKKKTAMPASRLTTVYETHGARTSKRNEGFLCPTEGEAKGGLKRQFQAKA
ncbi:hypothetical protein P153DRAFT_140625 [Dothidotthia symphoricarpi CBS 119687]|uniref:Uncharacterized protein n=1 Tax=Dothidotthia symphoricarpi CBS 119687 TaxID=1392245 RepID=A0A6A5ZYM7_9PLEO|nr:uncharacterized protein P153DRAFT_140625 [Dothidotthia symphoricarpi CBS 119687]KAF2123887.1 hypothetical protein P153DRAFT_140625 [Dothidotthia symphoricarpi CBS 119687]